jgi:hypothetical protein
MLDVMGGVVSPDGDADRVTEDFSASFAKRHLGMSDGMGKRLNSFAAVVMVEDEVVHCEEPA